MGIVPQGTVLAGHTIALIATTLPSTAQIVMLNHIFKRTAIAPALTIALSISGLNQTAAHATAPTAKDTQ